VIDGLVVVDKPAGWTSHDVVGKCRKIFGQRRVGHSGTLDPGAVGVLLVGLGNVTRLLRFLTDLPKSYEGTVVLGVATSTLDDSGEVVGRWDMAGIGLDRVQAAAATLTGAITQVPPMVSAVRVGGHRLHELARRGVEVERPARPVQVWRYDVAATQDPGVFRAYVECSSGTYVRVLAADLGALLGGGAHLRDLRRTAIGSFGLREARSLDQIAADPPGAVLSPAESLRDYPKVAVDAEMAARVGNGRPLSSSLLAGDGPCAVLDGAGSLLAVYAPAEAGLARPLVVVPASSSGP
jgi:tRNA pseudouridine55 synthase